MTREWDLTQEAFDRLLRWLDADRESAGKKYEAIRLRLMKIFTCRGCREAEDLADETINRVAKRLQELLERYTGDPAPYFYGVANKVHLEYLRRKPAPEIPPVPDSDDEIEREYACLESCMERLSVSNRQLVLEYYQDERRAKIDHRKQLAEALGIAVNALRIRAHRVRVQLQQCMQVCLERQPAH
ncbi:MAG: RNA polymerase sigma factor [Pyrinomonadaceae bacterium]